MSSLIDEVAALPGGAAVADALGTVDSATPGAADDVVTGWRSIGMRCADALPALSKALPDTEPGWTGRTAEAAKDYIGKVVDAGRSLSQAAVAATAALEQAANAVARAQQFARSRAEWLVSWVRSQDAAYPDVGSDARSKAITAVSEHVATEIRGVVDRTKSDLDAALAALRKAVGDVVTFSTLKSGDTPGQAEGHTGHRRVQVVSVTSPTGGQQDRPDEPVNKHAVPSTHTPPAQDGGQPTEGGSSASDGSAGGALGSGQGTEAGGGDQDSDAGPPSAPPSGEVKDWIAEALRILAEHGVDTTGIDPADIAAIIQHESSGDPYAVNNWDYNAAAGHPSKGIMQTIPSTFNAYNLPGHDEIFDPVDNIIAAVRYALDRYGSIDNVPGLAAMESGQGYVGY